MRPSTALHIVTGGSILAAIILAGGLIAQQKTSRRTAPGLTADTNTSAKAAANSYIDPAWCTQCHADIAKTYALTGMGRSFSKINADTMEEKFPDDQAYFHAASQSYFAIVKHDGEVFERRWQSSFDGQAANVEEKRIDYVLGSGNHAKTYLHLTARNTLQQLPLGWYAENGGTWGMIPGFDRADYPGSTRLVHYECMFCHNGYPKVPGGHSEEDAEPVFQQPLPMGIDCQRCHGPGQRHIETVGKPGATLEEIRASIVNPARLSPEREMEVCMECHLETTSLLLPHSIQRVNRAPFSYIPGQPLADFRLSFDRAPGQNTRFEVAGAAYRLRESQCFVETQRNDDAHRMTCTTCHDPHDVPRGEAAKTHYNAVCNECHAAAIAQAVAGGSHPSDPDCVSCHMPKRRTDDAIHIVMTDHLIQRKPAPDLLGAKTEYYETTDTSYKGEVMLYYPPKLAPTPENQLDIAAAQVKDKSNLRDGISQLAALIQKYRPTSATYYVDLADALHATGIAAESAAMYREALQHAPHSSVILLKLGAAQIDWQQWPNAETTLRGLVNTTPNDAVAWALLGQALFQENKNAEAREALTRAVSLDIDMAEPHNYLGGLLIRSNDLAGAEKEFREAVRLQPNHAEWQSNLAGLLAEEGKIPEARYLFELSIRLDPNFAGARLNYGRLLAALDENGNAEKQAQAAVEADANNPSAHELWGYLLAATGDAKGAVRELGIAIRLQPDFWRAHFELGTTLRITGDATGAAEQLRIAATGNDPEVRAAALQLLNAGR
ncbi:MAG TPA: tetratricopeptide repeat protein [Candidatus Acidoferrales bacterium]|nr:tetratricopeptide repeat protein [Candidatus Acidoferrales bacterium]